MQIKVKIKIKKLCRGTAQLDQLVEISEKRIFRALSSEVLGGIGVIQM